MPRHLLNNINILLNCKRSGFFGLTTRSLSCNLRCPKSVSVYSFLMKILFETDLKARPRELLPLTIKSSCLPRQNAGSPNLSISICCTSELLKEIMNDFISRKILLLKSTLGDQILFKLMLNFFILFTS